MKLNFRIALALFICTVLTAKLTEAQNYIEIGSGTVATSMPAYSSWNYSWSSLIYNHTDLGTAKSITKIALNCVNGPKTITNQKIYVKLASNDVFAAANYEDPTNNGYTLVFQGNLTFQTGWNEILLTTPIAYDGVQNILIHWENRWGATYGPQFNSTSSTINNTKNCGNDVSFPAPSQTGYLNPYPSSLTNMRFYYASTGPATPTNPIPAENASVVSVDTDLSWTLGANTTTYDLYMGTDPQNLPLIVSDAPCSAGVYSYTIPGLLADSTMHYWKVVAKNGAQQESSPVWKFKTEVVIDQFPYNEGFEDSLVFHTYPIVSAWQTAPDFSWYEYNVNAHSGLLCAKSSYYITGNQAIMRSPKVLLPPGYSISYFWRNTSVNKVAGYDTTFFEVSVNGGATWSKLDTLAPAAQNSSYVQRTRDLNSYAGNNFFFRFRHATDNSGSACNVYLDDISIFQTGITPTLLVTPSNQNVASPAGTTSFALTSNSAWTASSDQTWCTVNTSGTGNGTVTADYTENTTANQRIAHITITVIGLSPIVVTVTQGIAASTLSVSPSNQNVTSPAGTTSFTVTSNSSWTATSNQTWCTVTPSGSGNNTITATYTDNIELTPRIANITVTVAGLSPIMVTLTQEASAAFLTATPANQDVTYTAGTTNFSVNTNLAWTALSDAGWCAVTASGSGNGTLFATFAENTLAITRVAHITISGNGISPVTVTITQQGPAAVLSVTPQVQTISYLATVVTFAVTSNTNWSTASDAIWCQPTISGTGNGVISVTCTQNETMVTRTANLTVSASGVSPVILQVIQQPSYVSVNENNPSEIKVYPNPATDFVTVIVPEIAQGAFVQVFNANGEKVLEQNISKQEFRLDVSELRTGNYLMIFTNGNTIKSRKIVIM
jgi:hypothetical protein